MQDTSRTKDLKEEVGVREGGVREEGGGRVWSRIYDLAGGAHSPAM